jgi:Domain of unknown function (DUF4340)
MKLKTLLLTIALLAVASAIVYFVNRPAQAVATDPRIGTPLVDRATLEKAATLRFADQGKTVQFAKQADGSWHVVSYFDFPADFAKLSQFVGELQNAKIERLVSSNPARLARYEFKDTSFALLDGAGKDLAAVTLGKNAEGGGRLVRFGNEPKAYLARLSAYFDTEPRNWADAELVNLKNDDIAQVEIGFADGPAVVARRAKKEEPFVAEKAPEGQRLKADKIAALLSSLTSLRFTDTNAIDDANAVAAKQHLRTFKLTTFDGKTLTVALGRKPEQKIIKTPEPAKDPQKAGPAALLAKADEKPKTEAAPDSANPEPTTQNPKPNSESSGPAQALEPVTQTIPAGPVFAFVTSADGKAPIDALMQKRAFQIYEYTFTGLPQKVDELFEALPTPPPAPAQKAEEKPAEAKPAAAPAKG